MKDEMILVCTPASEKTPFIDNIKGKCTKCKKGVQYRPHAPKEAVLVCIPCFNKHYKINEIDDIIVTKETRQEIANMLKN